MDLPPDLVNAGGGVFMTADMMAQQLRNACVVHAIEVFKNSVGHDGVDEPVDYVIKDAEALYNYIKTGAAPVEEGPDA